MGILKIKKNYPTLRLSYITDFVFKMYLYHSQAFVMEINKHTSTLQQDFLLYQFLKISLKRIWRQTYIMPNSIKVRFQCII